MRGRRIARKIMAAGAVSLLVCHCGASWRGGEKEISVCGKMVAAGEWEDGAREPEASVSLEEAEDAQEALEEELAGAKQAIRELKESKGDVEDKVADLNDRLLGISARIAELEEELAEKNDGIAAAREELAAAQERKEEQYEDMKRRIQYMYENRRNSYLEVFLSAESFSGILSATEYISQIYSYDRQKLAEYGEAVEEIAAMEERLEQEYEELAAMKGDVEEEKAAVAALMEEREQELDELSGEIEAAQEEADYYAAELKAQEELIAAIKRAEAEKAAAGIQSGAYTGEAFTWPCPGSTRVTSDYGARTAPISGASSNHRGIDIGASYGADIVAAAAGTVVEAGYSSAGGNYVMIDHGGGLYTVYMHASSLSVSAGQEVGAGEVIAKVGSTGISTGNHLHFGVSLNGSYVSPWDYLG